MKPVCCNCQLDMRRAATGAVLVEHHAAGIYKLWSVDVDECRECGALVVAPSAWAQQPIAHGHEEPKVAEAISGARSHGLMIVHSFENTDQRDGWEGTADYARYFDQ